MSVADGPSLGPSTTIRGVFIVEGPAAGPSTTLECTFLVLIDSVESSLLPSISVKQPCRFLIRNPGDAADLIEVGAETADELPEQLCLLLHAQIRYSIRPEKRMA